LVESPEVELVLAGTQSSVSGAQPLTANATLRLSQHLAR